MSRAQNRGCKTKRKLISKVCALDTCLRLASPMPLQYKIQYRWDDRGTRRRTIKKHAYANTGKLAENGPSLDRSVKNSFHGSKDGNTERIATPKSPRGKGLKGHRASGGLERVVLPAGYCLYYAPGSGQ